MNIIYTGDVLRKNIDPMTNVLWLKEYTTAAIELCLGKNNVRTNILFNSGEYTSTEEDWMKQFDINTPSIHLNALEHMGVNKEDTLIVSFELPPNAYHQLTQAHYKVIDFSFHPVRFMNDLLFGVKTNIAPISKAFSVQTEDMMLSASRFKAKYYSGVYDQSNKKHIALLIGQTPVDASLIKDGKIVSFKDFEVEILQIRDMFEEVWLKPHPCQSDDEIMQSFLRLENFHLTGTNIYDLLSNPNIDLVVGISSSVLYESIYFGKQSQSFIPLSYKHEAIYGLAPNTVSFWSSLLKDNNYDSYYSFEDQIRMLSSQSILRKTRGIWWGYPQ